MAMDMFATSYKNNADWLQQCCKLFKIATHNLHTNDKNNECHLKLLHAKTNKAKRCT